MPPRFLDVLRITKVREARGFFGRSCWRLEEDFSYESHAVVNPLNGCGTIVVPAGYETDFASVPRLPLAYALAGDTAHEAAVVHDWLYNEPLVSRWIADLVFYEAMRVIGVPRWRAFIMWLAVRLFGWLAYKRRSNRGTTQDPE